MKLPSFLAGWRRPMSGLTLTLACMGACFPRLMPRAWGMTAVQGAIAAPGRPALFKPVENGHPAAGKVLWQIGLFNDAHYEFHAGVPSRPPLYVVGHDHDRNWYAFQPAGARKLDGAILRPAVPYTVEFTLRHLRPGAYRLRIAMLVAKIGKRVPWLQVDINGHRGWFFQRWRLDWKDGDQRDNVLPQYSSSVLRIHLPFRALRAGRNRLVLTAWDDPLPDGQLGALGGTTYTGLRLSWRPNPGRRRHGVSVHIYPTIYYVRGAQAGQVREVVNVEAAFRHARRPGAMQLTLAGRSWRAHWPAALQFGEARARFLVPVFPNGAPAQVKLRVNGRAYIFRFRLRPARRWTLYMVPNVHLDVGYTDYVGKVAEIQSRDIDEAMTLARQNPGFQYSVDGYWAIGQFLRLRSRQQRAAMIAAAQHGWLHVPAQYANLLTGFPSLETLIRSLYPSFRFHRKYHIPWNYDNITDVPSYSASWASVLAAAGIHNFIAGADNWRAPMLLLRHLQEHSPFYWEGADGAGVRMWYSRHYLQMALLFGEPPRVANGFDNLPLFLQAYDRRGYRPHAVLLDGSQVENSDLYPQQATLAARWNARFISPRLVYSGFHKALRAITRSAGALPVMRGDGGPYWEDGIASDARWAAVERRNEMRALSAEKFATVASLAVPGWRPPRGELARMWRQMFLMDEHTFNSGNSITAPGSRQTRLQTAVKNDRARSAELLSRGVLQRALAALAFRIHAPSRTLLVFNPLGWPQSGMVQTDLARGLTLLNPATRRPIKLQVLRRRAHYLHVRFWARKVPAVGYRTYALRTGHAGGDTQTVRGVALQNRYYRVILDPRTASVRSIYDRRLHRQLVNPGSPYRFDEYLYVTGADHSPNRVLMYSPAYPLPHLRVHQPRQGRLLGVWRTAWGGGSAHGGARI